MATSQYTINAVIPVGGSYNTSQYMLGTIFQDGTQELIPLVTSITIKTLNLGSNISKIGFKVYNKSNKTMLMWNGLGWDLINNAVANTLVANTSTTQTLIDVGDTNPPTTGQVLTATSPTKAIWADPTGGGGGGGLPSVIGNSGDFLYTDGATDFWKPIYASDVNPDPAITAFSSVTATLEVGQTTTTPAFTATYNQTPPSVTLYDSINTTPVTISTITSFYSTHGFTRTTLGSVTFTLTAAYPTPSIAHTNISWLDRTYYGHLTTFSTVSALQFSLLTSGYTGSYTITAATGEYLYFAIPTALGTPNFYVGGVEGGIALVSTTTYTNTYGVTVAYSIYKSDNPSLGTIAVVLE